MSWNALYGIDAFALLVFLVSYYRNCYRKGYKIDLWHAYLFLNCVFPLVIVFPFTTNPLNAVIVGQDFPATVRVMPQVFLLNMCGYFSLLLGGWFWKAHLGAGLRKGVAKRLEFFPRWSMMLMSSRDLMLFMGALCGLAQCAVLAIYFRSAGFGFNLRQYTFENPSIRPFTQIIGLTAIVVTSHAFARWYDTRERVLLWMSIALTFLMLFSGQRGGIIFTYLTLLICYFMLRRNSISLAWLATITGAALVFILYLGSARSGDYSLDLFLASFVFLIFFGNNFCDLRDFAWMYEKWDHQLWLGKTYLAGLATFMPRGISEFRATWSFGIATGWTVGLNTDLHPGLKPGQFGESFFNFGLAGVLITGLCTGILVRRADLDAKAALVDRTHASMRRAFASSSLLTLAAFFDTSLNVPVLYATVGSFALAWLFLQVRRLTAFPGSGATEQRAN